MISVLHSELEENMGTNNNDVIGKYNKPLQKIFNTRRQMFKAKSLMNLNVDKNEDYEDQECKHLLENSDEVRYLVNSTCLDNIL